MQHNENMMSFLSRCFYTVSTPLSGACIFTLHSWARTRPSPHQPVAAAVWLDKETISGSDMWFVAAEPSCSLLAKAEQHRDTAPRSPSIPEAAAAQGIRQQRATAVTPVVFSLWENFYMGYRNTELHHRGKKGGAGGGLIASKNRKM